MYTNFMKSFSTPYRYLLLSGILIFAGFYLHAIYSVNQIKQILNGQSTKQWELVVQRDIIRQYALELIKGQLKAKLSAESKEGSLVNAFSDYQYGIEAAPALAEKLSDVKGFKHLLCGAPLYFPDFPEPHDIGCWSFDGTLQWESPFWLRLAFINPETKWVSYVDMRRVNLFEWRLTSIELPVEEILDRTYQQFGSI